MARYRTVQAAGNAQEGGTAGGRLRVGYQVLTEPFEPVPSMKPSTSGSPTYVDTTDEPPDRDENSVACVCRRNSRRWQDSAGSRTAARGVESASFCICESSR